ncbi:hypothetical protein ACFQV4_11975 [Streptomyces thermocarboxydus]
MFGRTGLLSFGHALYIAGGYGTQLAMTELGLGLLPAALLTLLLGALAAFVLGAVSLRTLALGSVGFAMVTLAFAQAGSIYVERNPGGLTGGEEGLPLYVDGVPDALVGVQNTVNVYWLALAYLVLVAGVVWTVTARPAAGCGRRSGTTSSGSRCSAAARSRTSWARSCWRRPWRCSAVCCTCW